jgi:pimeloyl-ACP methyl ester carboxylesterase
VTGYSLRNYYSPPTSCQASRRSCVSCASLSPMTEVVTQTLPGAHWVQLEFPDQVNALIRKFLSTLGKSYLDDTVLSL